MLTVEHFNNRDLQDWIGIWTNQAERYPEFLAPLTYRILETQILGNLFFDPKGVFVARLDGYPVGVIHAAFGPSRDGRDIDRKVGIIYPPIIRDPLSVRNEVANTLIAACERYFHSSGTERIFAGGYANSSPFYSGLYGWTNPQGISEKDHDTIDVFRKRGYRRFREARRLRLVCAPYRPQITLKMHKVHDEVLIQKLERHSEPSWWDTNIYRNFETFEWNAFSKVQTAGGPIAGAVFRKMVSTCSSIGKLEVAETHFILSDIGVLESSLRRGIASLVLTKALCSMSNEYGSFIVDTVVDTKDSRLISFLFANNFTDEGLVRSFVKVVL